MKVQPYGASPEGLKAQRTWWLAAPGGEATAYAVAESKLHSGTVVAALEGVASPEQAAALKGREVSVPRSALPRPKRGEFYLADLVGLAVVGRDRARLGTVAGVEEYGAHPLLRVKDGERETLVPCVAPIVVAIDVDGGTIEVDWGAED